jgi:cell wall-associated NlpC family hydrolase
MRSRGTAPSLLLALALAGAAGCTGEETYAPGAFVTTPMPGAAGAPGPYAPRAPDPGSVVVAFAQAQVGHPYCWGGTGPRCFDCSGLVMTAWRQVGVSLPRGADGFAGVVPEVPLDQVRPGDVVWWPGHVGLYVSNGWIIDAEGSRYGVVLRRPSPPRRAFRPLPAY